MGWSVEIPQLPRLRGSELTEIMQRFPPALTVGYATWEQVQANAASPSNVRAMVRAYKECPAPFHALWQEAHGGMCTWCAGFAGFAMGCTPPQCPWPPLSFVRLQPNPLPRAPFNNWLPPPAPCPRTTLRKNQPLVPRSNSRITFFTRVVGFSCFWWMYHIIWRHTTAQSADIHSFGVHLLTSVTVGKERAFFFRGTGLPTAVRKNQPLVPRSNLGGKVCTRTNPWFRGQTLLVPGHGGGGGYQCGVGGSHTPWTPPLTSLDQILLRAFGRSKICSLAPSAPIPLDQTFSSALRKIQHRSGGGGGAAQPRHTNDGAPRTRKRHPQEHRPQRPTERSDPTQHAKGGTGDCPGPRKGATTRRNVTQGGWTPPPP